MPGPLNVANLLIALTDGLSVQSASDGVEALLGYASEEFLASRVHFKELIHPGDADIAQALFSPDSETRTGSVTFRLRHADGRIRCVKGRYTRLRPRKNHGEPLLKLVLRDVRQVREAGDRSLAANFQSLIEHTRDYVLVKNRNQVILAASRAWASLTESASEPENLLGKTVYDLFPEAVADVSYRLVKQALREERRTNEILQLPAQDGSKRWIDGRVFPVNRSGGEVVGIFCIAPDITDYIEASLRLRESEESLNEAQKIAGLCSYVLDIVTGVWKGSETLNAVLGIDATHPRTLSGWVTVIHPDDRQRMAGALAQIAARRETAFLSEYRIVRPSDGNLRWIRALGRVEYGADGKALILRGTLQDITESKQTENDLRDSKKLLELFVDHAPVALAMFDREMRYLALSRRWAEDHRIGAREVIGRSHYEVNPEVPERWKETHRRGLAGETQRVEVDRYDRADGAIEWIRWQITPWRADDGSVGGIVLFYEDITERKRADAAMRESKELLQLFIDRAPSALAMFDREMRYLAVSRRWLEEYSLAGQEILGRVHYDIVPDVPERWKEAHRRGLAGETLKADADRFERGNGAVQWIRWEVVPWRAGDGSVGGIILFAEDITQQKEAEARLRLAADVFTHASEGIVITDPNGTILEVNDAFTRITGYSHAEVIGQNPRLLKSGLQSREFYENLWSSLSRDGQWSGEIWNRAKSGNVYAETLSINAIRDAAGKTAQYVALFSDITEHKKHQQQLEHIAHHDALTGLPNRVLLADRLSQAMAHARRQGKFLAVAYFDLDGFKEVNDRYGHEGGDRLLTTVAGQMKAELREGDTLAHLGGDEFVAVLLDLPNRKSGEPVLERLLQAAAAEVWLDGRTSCGFRRAPAWPCIRSKKKPTPTCCCARPARRCTRPNLPAATASIISIPATM